MTAEIRAQTKSQRTIELLLQSREPFGMKDHEIRSHVQYRIRHYPTCYSPKPTFQPHITKSDHEIRSHVQYRIRHYPTCYSPKPTFQPHITKSVPDFRALQLEFESHLHNARKSRPSTVVQPFHFHNSQFSKHYCENMKTYQRRSKHKITATKTTKLSSPAKTSSSRLSSNTSATFIV
uniref:Uncharacterized protein n=1 Tax=Panagrolaimus sp. ES5 TaxID=591445 RepID=A0AC34F5S9_9BILA